MIRSVKLLAYYLPSTTPFRKIMNGGRRVYRVDKGNGSKAVVSQSLANRAVCRFGLL